jgi:hypothetical protein
MNFLMKLFSLLIRKVIPIDYTGLAVSKSKRLLAQRRVKGLLLFFCLNYVQPIFRIYNKNHNVNFNSVILLDSFVVALSYLGVILWSTSNAGQIFERGLA